MRLLRISSHLTECWIFGLTIRENQSFLLTKRRLLFQFVIVQWGGQRHLLYVVRWVCDFEAKILIDPKINVSIATLKNRRLDNYFNMVRIPLGRPLNGASL